MLQRRAANTHSVSGVPPIVHDVLSSPGRPLDSGTRGFMEPRFGHDFSHVRVHDDARAAESARAVDAHAYTVGDDIVFNTGRYDSGSHSGRQLLAHELAHTIQQRGMQRSTAGVSQPSRTEDRRLEYEAERAASTVVSPQQGAMPPMSRAGRPVLSRDKQTGTDSGEPEANQPENTQVYGGLINEFGSSVSVKRMNNTLVEGGPPTAPDNKHWPKLRKRAYGNGTYYVRGHLLNDNLGGPGNDWKNLTPLSGKVNNWGEDSHLKKFEAPVKKAVLEEGRTVDFRVEAKYGRAVRSADIKTLRDKNTPEDTAKADIIDAEQYIPTVLECSAIDLGTGKPVVGLSGPVVTIQNTIDEDLASYLLTSGKSAAAASPVSAAAEFVALRYGDKTESVEVPGGWTGKAKAPAVPITGAASTLVDGFLLKTLNTQPGGRIVVHGQFDDSQGKLPVEIKDKDKGSVRFTVSKKAGEEGDLKLVPEHKNKAIKIAFPLLSPGEITHFETGPKGLEFAGWIQPSIPLLGKLGVEYKNGELTVLKGIEEATLKKHSLLGMQVTKAQVKLKLAPTFEPSGRVEMRVGSEDAPLATASLDLSADSIGLVGVGKIKANIPKMKSAESDLTYKGGGGRNEWTAKIEIKSEDISLGSGISVTGGFKGQIEKGEVSFDGKVNATFPGNNTAELGLSREPKQGWILHGGGTFHFPSLDETTVKATYYLEKDTLVATGKTGFTIKALKLKGDLTQVTFTIAKGQPLKVHGEGSLKFKTGKADGEAVVKLNPNGKFSGKGTLSYKLKENVIVTGTVELSEQEKLSVTGELLVTRYEFFKQYSGKKDLFNLDLPVPVPGLSIGTSGLVFHIKGGVGVAYSFGPGTLEPLKFSAGFDPLESDPDLKLTVTGSVKIPASATLSAYISGSLAVQVDILVGSAGVEGGVKLQGDLILNAGAFANFDAEYKKKRLTAKLVAGIDTKLLLGLSLTAFARAWAGAFGIYGEVRKDWVLASKKIDTRLGFYLSAPFEYADDTGVKLPEFKDITLKEPELTTENLKRILGEIFGAAPEKKIEK